MLQPQCPPPAIPLLKLDSCWSAILALLVENWSQAPSVLSQVPTCFCLIQAFLSRASCSFSAIIAVSQISHKWYKPSTQTNVTSAHCTSELSSYSWHWIFSHLETDQVKLHTEKASNLSHSSFPSLASLRRGNKEKPYWPERAKLSEVTSCVKIQGGLVT